MPVVLFDRVVGEINCDKVIVDDFKGAYDATKLLIDKGREYFAFNYRGLYQCR